MSDMICNSTIQTEKWSLENNGWRALRHLAPTMAETARRYFEVMCAWQRRAEMRSRMARMDDRMLDDIGLNREQVTAEAAKPFWQD
jgi:uncharacterized protein YjiS (DUF1127 family)